MFSFRRAVIRVVDRLFPSLLLCSIVVLMSISAVRATEPINFDTYDQSLFLDAAWYRENQVVTADLFNGGLDGETGMGAYGENFDGFFYASLDREWQRIPFAASTSVAQSRAIYYNVEAYRAVAGQSGEQDGERFLNAVNAGADFLLSEFRDSVNGGFFWQVTWRGNVQDGLKQGYGNVHPIFALAQAYSITNNPDHLQAALDQLDLFKTRFLDPNFECGIHPNFSRNFSEIIGYNNIDVFTHFFEALLALHDVTEGEQRDEIDNLIVRCGDFLVNTLYNDQEGFTDRGYVAYHYDENWQPSQIPYTPETHWNGTMHATPGHNIELAYLLSRAVERGFDPEWLITADKLIRFCLEYTIHPEYGGMIYDITDYEGQPLEGNPDNALFIWWAQAETARALLHFLVVRGVDEYAEPFKRVEYLYDAFMIDQEYGGAYWGLNAENDLEPFGIDKANVWKVNYHNAMFFAEVLRLQAEYPDRIDALNASFVS